MRSAPIRLLLTALCGLLVVAGLALAAVSSTGNLTAARTQAAGAAIVNAGSTSSVLVTGGRSNTGALLATSERYDPATGVWSAAASLPAVRAGHTAFFVPPTGALASSRVVVVGGRTFTVRQGEIANGEADRYDPATNTWDPGLAMNTPRVDFASALTTFRDGNPRIIVTGGATLAPPETVTNVDVYDIVNDAWTTLTAMPDQRRNHAAVALPDGRVMVAGGYNVNGALLNTTAIYNPVLNSWTAGPNMAAGRARFTLSVVDGTHILAAGGVNAAGTPLASTESYDPVKNAWTDAGTMAVARADQQATVVRGGWVVVTGGRGTGAGASGLDSAESWTPANGWGGPQALPGSQTLGGVRVDHVAAALPQTDEVLVAGGGIPAGNVPGTVVATAARWSPDKPVVVPSTVPPTDPPATTPPQDPPPALVPVQGRTLVAGRASGNIFIRIGTTDEYRELKADEALPIGTVIDATDGHVRITGVRNGVLQTAEFWGGTFTITQSSIDGYIEVRLYGKLKCATKKATKAVKRKAKPKAWGDGKGKFRTKGVNSTASVRGTRWLVEERCTGTFTKVARGVVSVRDFPKHKTVSVKAGKNYLARPRR